MLRATAERGRRSNGRRAALLLAAAAFATGCVPAWDEQPLGALVGTPSPASQRIGCERAAEHVVLTVPAHLDPACTYTGGFEIRASGVVLDCRGARIEDVSGNLGRGIHVAAPADASLSDVTVRNCVVAGFLNNVRISREGFEDLAPGAEYLAPFSNIVVENSHLYRSRGSGVFVNAYVTGVALRDLEIAGSGSVGVYLEAGSRESTVERSRIHHNGFADTGPEGVAVTVEGLEFRYHSTGREGIAVDGSRANRIRDNAVYSNSAGGIFLYENCGEFYTQRPEQWWPRRTGADDNVIEGNDIEDEETGVWIGSRMAENQFFMDCSEPAYVSAFLLRIHRDHAARNVVRGNRFSRVTYGVRVEDDGARVEGNLFLANDPAARAVLVGSKWRTIVLGAPVAGVVIESNDAALIGVAAPYRWIHGHADTAFAGNRAFDAAAGAFGAASLVEGEQPPIDPFLFAIDFWRP